jgi:curved DNA-binding protein
VLSDPVKRQRYDTLGADWAQAARPGPGPRRGRVRVDMGEGFDVGDAGGFSDFFRSIFGGGGGFQGGGFEDAFGARGPAQPAEMEAPVELSLEEALRGTARAIQLGERRIEVKIPAGVREGQRIRVPASATGGGDIYLRVRLLGHPQFERSGDDLQTPVAVPLTTAVLGGEAVVPTLEGPRGIKVPPGSRVGQVFRLAGQGLPKADGGRGDVLARLAVELPKGLSAREIELFTELRSLGR